MAEQTVEPRDRAANSPLSRRALLRGASYAAGAATIGGGAILAEAVAASAMPGGAGTDPAWVALVSDCQAKRDRWLDEREAHDKREHAFRTELQARLPKPQKPESAPIDKSMSLTEILALSATPEHKAAWATYERDQAAWKTDRDALMEQMVGSGQVRYNAAWAEYESACAAVASYRPSTAAILAEKIGIIIAEYDGGDIPSELIGYILADVRHLAREA